MEKTKILNKALLLIPCLFIAVILVSGCVSSGTQAKFDRLEEISNEIAAKSNEIGAIGSKLQVRGAITDQITISQIMGYNKELQTKLDELESLITEGQGIIAELKQESLSGKTKEEVDKLESGFNHLLAGVQNMQTASTNLDKALTFTKTYLEAAEYLENTEKSVNLALSAYYNEEFAEAETKIADAKTNLQSAKTKLGQSSNLVYFAFTQDFLGAMDLYEDGLDEFGKAVDAKAANRDIDAYNYGNSAASLFTNAAATVPTSTQIDAELGVWVNTNFYTYLDKAVDEFTEAEQVLS